MRIARREESSCKICGRASGREFCDFHEEAIKKLREHFEVWKERKGVSWEGYLREVARNEKTGEWVREVAKYFIKESR